MTGDNPVALLSNGGERNGWCILTPNKFTCIKRA